MGALIAAHHEGAFSLNGIGSSFVHRLARVNISEDFLVTQDFKCHRGNGRRLECASVDDGHTGDDLVFLSAEAL